MLFRCAAAAPIPGHSGEHAHAAAPSGPEQAPCHGPPQLGAPCPCGCDEDAAPEPGIDPVPI